jgi:3-oxoacyl-[acyl-carrier protein] reductase
MNSKHTICISGTSRGLGRALALELARDYNVVGFARHTIQDISDSPYAAQIVHIDGIDASDYRSLDKLEDHLAACDGLVNNVGMAEDGLLATQPFDAISHLIDVNLTSVLYLTRLYVRARLRAQKPGVVVTISSIVSIRGFSGLAAYSATKGALNAMTRSLARELGPKQFRFNAVLPGFLNTDLSASLSMEQRRQIIRRTPLGRLGESADVVGAVRFLLSDEAQFITGQILTVDGGCTA